MKLKIKIIGAAFLSIVALEPISALALTKTETVYSTLDSTGIPTKITVNNHLSKLTKGQIIDDTELKNILNMNGEETFTLGQKEITWKSTGKDIFYQGKTEKELPISLDIHYYLNNKEKKGKEMIGKKGDITIKLSFKNNDYHSEQKLYTPFVVTMFTTISNKENSNIKVSNGKLIDTGTKNMVVALSAPGLYENLKVEQLKGLNEITISYHTTKFSLDDIYFIATPKLFGESDINSLNQLDSINHSLYSLQDNMNQLEKGAFELQAGVNTAYQGIATMKKTLDQSIHTLKNDHSDALDQHTIDVIKNQTVEKATLTEEQKTIIGNQAMLSVDETVNNNISALEKSGINDDLVSLCENNPIPDEYLTTCQNSASYIAQYKILKNPDIIQLLKETAQTTAIKTAEQTSQTTASQVSTTLAREVANSVKQGASEKFLNSLTTLSDNLGLLEQGSKSLSNGSNTLSTGISQLNSQGIHALTNYGKIINNYSDKTKRLVKLSKEYSGYTSINADKTLFIYKIKSLTK